MAYQDDFRSPDIKSSPCWNGQIEPERVELVPVALEDVEKCTVTEEETEVEADKAQELPKPAYKKRESFLSLTTTSTSSEEFNAVVRSLSPPTKSPFNGSSESLQSNSVFMPTPVSTAAAVEMTRQESEVIRIRSDEDFKEYLETLSGAEEEEDYEKEEEEVTGGGDDYEDDFT